MASEAAVSATSTAGLAVAAGWHSWQIYNNGSVAVYYGYDAAVTAVTGTPIMPAGVADDRSGWAFPTTTAPTIYVITASGTADCRVLVIQ